MATVRKNNLAEVFQSFDCNHMMQSNVHAGNDVTPVFALIPIGRGDNLFGLIVYGTLRVVMARDASCNEPLKRALLSS